MTNDGPPQDINLAVYLLQKDIAPIPNITFDDGDVEDDEDDLMYLPPISFIFLVVIDGSSDGRTNRQTKRLIKMR